MPEPAPDVVKLAAEAMRSLVDGFRTLAAAAARAAQATRADYALAPPPPGTPAPHHARDGRPPWQTPYGPPTRRH